MSRGPHHNAPRHVGPMPQYASKGRAWTAEHLAELKRRRDAGEIFTVIAEALGRSPENTAKKYRETFGDPEQDDGTPATSPSIKAHWPEWARFRDHPKALELYLRFSPDPRYSVPPPFGRSSMGSAAALCVGA